MFGFGFGFGFKSYGVGVGKELALAYKLRVIADGGVYENNTCLVRFLNNLNNI